MTYRQIFKYFLTWRLFLFGVALFSIYIIPNFGARFPYYNTALEITKLPNWIWGFGNFDGVHYLRIAQKLYEDTFTQAFFPLFPLLIKIFSHILPRNLALDTRIFVDPSYFYSGLFLSNVFFLISLPLLYKLYCLDFSKEISKLSLIMLLLFPTSFYFVSIYAESLFLLLSICSIYFLRKEKFILASVFISLATATKIFGLLLIIVYLIESLRTKVNTTKIIGLLITPLGFLIYVTYLKLAFGNPFYFLTSQSSFGAQRLVNGLVFLPQVLYRYLKILTSVTIFSLPYLNAVLEVLFTVVALVFVLSLYKKMRLSYWLFTLSALILPSMTGTLSSMPRYVLVGFLALPFLAQSKYYRQIVTVFGFLSILLISLFIRGYWVA